MLLTIIMTSIWHISYHRKDTIPLRDQHFDLIIPSIDLNLFRYVNVLILI